MSLQSPTPSTLIGTIRRFGPHGVLYEIVKLLDEKRALIRVLDTGEQTPYALENIIADPTH
jgi:uncharacterized protein DUF5397